MSVNFYTDLPALEQDKEDEDSLAAMKKRVAAIEAETAKISAMSADIEEDEMINRSSLTPQPKGQSVESHSSANGSNKNSNGSNANSRAQSLESNHQDNEQKTNDVSAPTEGAEQ